MYIIFSNTSDGQDDGQDDGEDDGQDDNDDYDSNITAKWADLCDGEQLPR